MSLKLETTQAVAETTKEAETKARNTTDYPNKPITMIIPYAAGGN